MRNWKKVGNGNFRISFVHYTGRVQRKLNPAKGEPIYTCYIERLVAEDDQGNTTKLEVPEIVFQTDAWKIEDGKSFVMAAARNFTYLTYNMLNRFNEDGTKRLFPMPITTEYFCDPSSEAYHCM